MATTKNSTNLFSNLTGPTDDTEQAAIDAQENETTMTPDETEEEDEIPLPEIPEVEMPSEIDLLKQRAKMMAIPFSPNIGVDALKAKITAKLSEDAPAPVEAQPVASLVPAAAPIPEPVVEVAQGPAAIRRVLAAENMRLIRIRITNLDPNDKDLPGGIITVANEYLGTVSRYVPYGETTDNGWHVEYCLYKFLRAQKFLKITIKKVNGKEQVTTAWVRKFALEELPPLTDKEIDTLKAAQLGAGNLGDD